MDPQSDPAAQALASLTGGPVPRHRLRRVRLPLTAAAPNEARSLLATALNQWHVPYLRETATLVISELVSNAVRHTGTELEVCLVRHDAGVCIAVVDDSPDLPCPRPDPPAGAEQQEGGRGLRLVSLLAYRWGWLVAGRFKVVWAFLAAAAPKSPQLAV